MINVDVSVLPDRTKTVQFQISDETTCEQFKEQIKLKFQSNVDFEILINDLKISGSDLVYQALSESQTNQISILYQEKKESNQVENLDKFVSDSLDQVGSKTSESQQGLKDKLDNKSIQAPQNQEIQTVSHISNLKGFLTSLPSQVTEHQKFTTSNLSDKLRQTNKNRSAQSIMHENETEQSQQITNHEHPLKQSLIGKVELDKTKNDDHPSVIQQEEEEQEFKFQNETVLNILDNLDHSQIPQNKKPVARIQEIQAKNQKSGSIIKIQTFQPNPMAQQFKDRQEKAKKEFNDPNSHLKSQQLLQKLESQRKQVEKRREQNYQKQNKELNDSIEHQKQQKEETLTLLREQKRQEIQKKLEDDRQKKLLQMQINNESNKLLKELKREIKEDLYFRQRNDEEEKNQELYRRKQAIEKKRELYRPVSLQQLQQHAKDHDDNIKLLRLEKDREKIERDIEQDKRNLKVQRSKFTTIIETEDKLNKNLLEEKKKEKRLLQARKMKYAEVVKDMFQPQIRDRSKELQIKQQKELLDLSTQQYYEFDEFVKVRNLAQNLSKSPLSNSKEKQRLLDLHLNQAQFRGFLSGEENLKKLKKALESSKNGSQRKAQENVPNKIQLRVPQLLKPKFKEPIIIPEVVTTKVQSNYLQVLRNKREEKERSQAQTQTQQLDTWRKLIPQSNTMKPSEKYFTAMTSIHKLENRAKQKEQLHQQDEANELYINSIKAKLSLLDQYDVKPEII